MSGAISTDSARRAVDPERPTPAGKRDVWLVFWIVPAFYLAFGVIFFALARVMPPPRPDVTQAQMTQFFADHTTTIKIGFGLLILIVGGAGIANGIVAYHMKRMSVGSVLAYAYIGSMAVGALPGCLLVAFCFLTATLRPDRDPQLMALLYDLGLLSYVGSLGASRRHTSPSPSPSSTTATTSSPSGSPTCRCGRSSPRSSPCRCSSPRPDPSPGTARSPSGWARSSSVSG
jgi:uncharacterized membrane protein (DUF441 family)